MVIVEHGGIEYALITHQGEKIWVNACNRRASKELAVILREQASLSGVSGEKLDTPKFKPKLDIQTSFKSKVRRPRKKSGGISLKVNLTRDRS